MRLEGKSAEKVKKGLEVIPALYIKDLRIHYALNLSNLGEKKIENVKIDLIANKEKFIPEKESKEIKYIEPGEHARITFELEPLGEFRNEAVRAKIKYTAGEEAEEIEIEPRYLSMEFTALYPREVIEAPEVLLSQRGTSASLLCKCAL